MIALIDDSHIAATPYFETASSNDETTGETETATSQETKAKSRIAAEILANGYLLQDHIVAKGLEYDNKYSLTSRFNSYLSTLQNNGKWALDVGTSYNHIHSHTQRSYSQVI